MATGKIKCLTCDLRVTAILAERPTRLLSYVQYTGHTNRINGVKVKCPNGRIDYGGVGFPQWAYNALKNLPLGD